MEQLPDSDPFVASNLASVIMAVAGISALNSEGGTGTAPSVLIDYVGLPITIALPVVTATRERHKPENRIRIIASARLITPDKVAWALCKGADFVSRGLVARVARHAMEVRQEVEIIAHACGLTDPTGFPPKHVTEIERGVGGFRASQRSD